MLISVVMEISSHCVRHLQSSLLGTLKRGRVPDSSIMVDDLIRTDLSTCVHLHGFQQHIIKCDQFHIIVI